MRFAMTSRVSHCLLVAALAFLVLPSYGTAQAPRRPQQPDTPYRAATRALNEGRYDDVDAIADKMDARDPNASVRPGVVHRIDKDTSGILVVA